MPATITKSRRTTVSILLRSSSYLFLIAGICALGYVVYLYAIAYTFEKTASIAASSRPPKAPSFPRAKCSARSG
jgi:hypothetical protein